LQRTRRGSVLVSLKSLEGREERGGLGYLIGIAADSGKGRRKKEKGGASSQI